MRIDERMPYIDQGYVDESADVIGNVGKKDRQTIAPLTNILFREQSMKMFSKKKDEQ